MDILDSTTADIDAHNIFLRGDFNAHLDANLSQPNANTPSQTSNKQNYIDRINSLTSSLNLTDAWKQRNPTSHKGTFHWGNYSARLDYWFLSNHLLPSISSFEIIPHPLSKHSMFKIDVGMEQLDRGPGYWRFNNTLLQDTKFVSKMSSLIVSTINESSFQNPNTTWAWIKFQIRKFCVSYSITKNREKRKFTKQLKERLAVLAHDHNLIGSPDVVLEVRIYSDRYYYPSINLQNPFHSFYTCNTGELYCLPREGYYNSFVFSSLKPSLLHTLIFWYSTFYILGPYWRDAL